MKILNFQGPEIDPLRDCIQNRQIGGQKSKSSRGNFRGESPPPPRSVRLDPPLSPSPIFHQARLTFSSETETGLSHFRRPRSLCANVNLRNSWELLHELPKGPSRTKNTTESEFRYGEKIRYGRSKTLRRGLINACFSRQKRQENGTESEKLRP